MTAEIAILNREAVALAADSAVTVGGADGHKIFTSANKIFALSRRHPVGIMLYGSATIADVPWETIVKLYRDQLGDRSFPTLDDYVEDFFTFLHADVEHLFPASIQEDHVKGMAHVFLSHMREQVDQEVEKQIQSGATVTAAEVADILATIIDDHYQSVMAGKVVPTLPAGYSTELRKRYSTTVDTEIAEVLKGHTLTGLQRRRLRQMLFATFIRRPAGYSPRLVTGLVFAGFGDEQVFPCLREWHVESVAADQVTRYDIEERAIDIGTIGTRASIAPFAQAEMVYRFMEGVDPVYQAVVESIIQQVIEGYPTVLLAALPGASKKQKETLEKRARQASRTTMATIRTNLQRVRTESFSQPVSMLVNLLPKDELAAMAEALVNLTSFKRRMSWDAETVGGPIDVVVISKGDGLIWIKRKHYFSPELNPAFMTNRYGGGVTK